MESLTDILNPGTPIAMLEEQQAATEVQVSSHQEAILMDNSWLGKDPRSQTPGCLLLLLRPLHVCCGYLRLLLHG